MLKAGQTYSGRRPDRVVRNFTWDREADELMRRYCPAGTRGMGEFFTKLVIEYHARMEERRRIMDVIVANN
jgi:hypothetical protein